MKVIRTFVAVLIAEDLRGRIFEVQQQVKKLAPDVKWVAPENFHVTLKFLGNVQEDSIPDIGAALGGVAQQFSPFDLSVAGLGAFPNPARARIVWVGIERGREELRALFSSVEAALGKLGFEPDEKGFKAHITIGRVKDSRRLTELAAGIGDIDATELGTQRIESLALMQSELQRGGPVYSPLSVIDLGTKSTLIGD